MVFGGLVKKLFGKSESPEIETQKNILKINPNDTDAKRKLLEYRLKGLENIALNAEGALDPSEEEKILQTEQYMMDLLHARTVTLSFVDDYAMAMYGKNPEVTKNLRYSLRDIRYALCGGILMQIETKPAHKIDRKEIKNYMDFCEKKGLTPMLPEIDIPQAYTPKEGSIHRKVSLS